MKINISIYRISSGFSLIEMAIVLFIVALLLGGLLPTVSSQMEQQHRSETRKQLNEIQQALIGFAVINKRLPFAACGTIATGNTNAGVELIPASAALCTTGASDNAVLPWVTLGVGETDGWGKRFSYFVSPNFSAMGGFALTTTSSLQILNGGSTISNGTPAIIISHGTNGLGAYISQGTKISNTSAGADEITNSTSSTTSFVSKDVTPSYDDQIVWLSPNILFNRMVAAGKLP